MSGSVLAERPDAPATTTSDRSSRPRPVGPPRAGPRRPTFGRWLAGALLAGLALRVAIGLTDDAPTTDEVTYIASGVSLADGDGFTRDGHPELHFPPLVPWLIGTTSRGRRRSPHGRRSSSRASPARPLVLPVALAARRLGGDAAGAVAAWAAALAPGLATLPATRGAGSEAEYAAPGRDRGVPGGARHRRCPGGWMLTLLGGRRARGGPRLPDAARGPGLRPAPRRRCGGRGLAFGERSHVRSRRGAGGGGCWP